MAIFNSIVLGKASGKIGNVVLCGLKGQNIAKSRNYSPTNPRTVAQVNSRAKMSNAVMAYQFLAVFLLHINALRKSTESNYNAFIRLTKNAYSSSISGSPAIAATDLSNMSFASSDFAKIISADYDGSVTNISFDNNSNSFLPDTHVRVISFNADDNISLLVDRLITESEWNSEMIHIPNWGAADGLTGAYLYSNIQKKCSNLAFGSV